jgi:hypothetical protein
LDRPRPEEDQRTSNLRPREADAAGHRLDADRAAVPSVRCTSSSRQLQRRQQIADKFKDAIP